MVLPATQQHVASRVAVDLAAGLPDHAAGAEAGQQDDVVMLGVSAGNGRLTTTTTTGLLRRRL